MEEKELEKKAPGEAEAENIPENGAGAETQLKTRLGRQGPAQTEKLLRKMEKKKRKRKRGFLERRRTREIARSRS